MYAWTGQWKRMHTTNDLTLSLNDRFQWDLKLNAIVKQNNNNCPIVRLVEVEPQQFQKYHRNKLTSDNRNRWTYIWLD